ncbi:MAG: hypothetical protein WD847_08060 [Pirellulales bacterium]
MSSSHQWLAGCRRLGRGLWFSRWRTGPAQGPSRPAKRVFSLESLEQRRLLAFAPLGSEFQVNTETTEDQRTWSETPKSAAMDANGNFVATWSSFDQDGETWGVYAQRFNAAGAKVGGEFRANNTTADQQLWSSVAMDDDGDFVITWTSGEQDGDGLGVYARRYNASGVAQGGEFLVNTHTADDQRWSTAAMDANGNFVITWSSFGQDELDSSGVYAQRFNAAGTKLGSEFRVNSTTAETQYLSNVAMNSSGAFVITWSSGDPDSGALDVFAQRYASNGSAQGGEFLVNTHTDNAQFNSSIGIDDDGDFVISWTSALQDGSSNGIYAQRFNASGVKQGSEFRVNTHTSGNQAFSTVAMNGSGGFVISWSSNLQDGSDFGIYGQQYTAAGAADGGEFPVNSTTVTRQWLSSVAMDDQGEFVVTWTSFDQDGSFYGVFGQRFGVPATFTLDVDANAEADALTDGILMVRHLFGFSGNALINGAIGDGATRTTAAAIDAYLDQAVADGMLDVDGNGEADALTDGILVVRYLFGFSGNALINGAIGTGATRTTAAAIDAYLDSLMPGAGAASTSTGSLAVSAQSETETETKSLSAPTSSTSTPLALDDGGTDEPGRFQTDWLFAQYAAEGSGTTASTTSSVTAAAADDDEYAPPSHDVAIAHAAALVSDSISRTSASIARPPKPTGISLSKDAEAVEPIQSGGGLSGGALGSVWGESPGG